MEKEENSHKELALKHEQRIGNLERITETLGEDIKSIKESVVNMGKNDIDINNKVTAIDSSVAEMSRRLDEYNGKFNVFESNRKQDKEDILRRIDEKMSSHDNEKKAKVNDKVLDIISKTLTSGIIALVIYGLYWWIHHVPPM